MKSAVFEKKVPGPTVMNRRYAWKVSEGRYEVVSRDAEKRYRVDVVGGMPLCTCTAAKFGMPCWHAATVLRRLINEGVVA